MERFERYKREKSYLYLGLFLAAIALLMIVESVHGYVHDRSLLIQLTGLGAGICWGIASFICMKHYYISNRIETDTLDEKTDTAEKNSGT